MYEALTESVATNMKSITKFKVMCGKFHVYIISTLNVRAEIFRTERE
jgi:hypothetical protein